MLNLVVVAADDDDVMVFTLRESQVVPSIGKPAIAQLVEHLTVDTLQ